MTVEAKDALTHFHIQFETTGSEVPAATGAAAALNAAVWADDALDGQISEYTPPPLVLRLLDWPTHVDGIQAIDGGMENLEATLVSLRYTGEFLRLFRRVIVLTCYNAIRSGATVRQLKHELTGTVTGVDLGTVDTGTTPKTVTMTMNVDKFRAIESAIGTDGAVSAAVTLIDIDVNARKREIGGVDQLAGIKAALGVS